MNPEFFLPSDPLKIFVNVKNIEKIVVKIYEIDSGNVFREHLSHISTTTHIINHLQVGGMVALKELVYNYEVFSQNFLRNFFTMNIY